MTFVQVASSPALAPYAKFPYILRQIAKCLDLDEDKVTNNNDEAMLQAMVMQQMGSMPAPGAPGMGQPGQPQQPQGGSPAPSGANVQDTAGSGGGQTNPGSAVAPGNPGFAGNTGGQ